MVKIERNYENLIREGLDTVAAIPYGKFELVARDNFDRLIIEDLDGIPLATIEFGFNSEYEGYEDDEQDVFKQLIIYTNRIIDVTEMSECGLLVTKEIKLEGKSSEEFMEYAKLLESKGYNVTINY